MRDRRDETPAGSGQATLQTLWTKRAKANYAATAHAAFICGMGISPYAVDTDWWKEFMQIISAGRYTLVTLVDSYISREAAAWAREKQITYLQSNAVMFLSYPFDAGREPASSVFTSSTDQARSHFITAVDRRTLR